MFFGHIDGLKKYENKIKDNEELWEKHLKLKLYSQNHNDKK